MNKTSEEYARELDDAERRFLEGFARWQQEREPVSPLAQLPVRALTWLALAPEWPLALAVQGFPAEEGLISGEAARAELKAIYDARACQSADSDDGRGRVFWMNPAQQSSVLELLKKLPDERLRAAGLRDFLRQQLSEASAAMERASAEGGALNAPLRRWIELARSAEKDADLAKLLRDNVEQAIKGAEVRKQVVSPEAIRWIRAAKPFVEWFGEPVEWAVAQTSRRLELFYRRAYDERSLKNYYVRPEQERAFDELLEGSGKERPPGAPERPWALHYVGLGGTGKTMLMRHISAQLAKQKNLAVARVDFDRLNPDYPSRAPGLLLMSFAEELRPFAAEVGSDIFQRFDKEVDSLHESISSAFRSGAPRTVGVEDDKFQLVLSLFTDAVRRLFEVREGVVLILDTCEELARIRSDNTLPDSVHVTFDILERIQRRVDRLRVVFSGRRPLARAGHVLEVSAGGTKKFAWTCPASKLPERDYLRLYEIRGFRRHEALEFLSQYTGEAEVGGAETHVKSRLFEEIVNQSCSADERFDSRFERHDGRGDAGQELEPRYNPYDLDMFAHWATCDSKLTEKDIKAGANHYVRERIIKRADYRIRAVLPVVMLLGRFNESLIRRLIQEHGGDAELVFPELVQSELLDVDRNATEAGTVWVMDAIMRKRLRKFYAEEMPSDLGAAMRTLAQVMSEHTLTQSWNELSPSYFVTALEVLTPDRAARWWSEVEKRLAAEAQWNWAKSITDELLAEGGPAAEADEDETGREPREESSLRPAVLATQASALTHLLFTDPRADRNGLHDIWAEVRKKARRHPTAEGALLLERRAVAGMGAALRWRGDVPEGDRVRKIIGLWRELPPVDTASGGSVAASDLAMMESLVEVAEEAAEKARGKEKAELVGELRQFYGEHFGGGVQRSPPSPRELRVFDLALLARLRKLCGLHKEALDAFDVALGSLHDLGPARFGPALQRWPDWHQPDDLFARVALEHARHVGTAYRTVKDTFKQLDSVIGSPSPAPPSFVKATLDNERLASALLQLRAQESASGLGSLWDDESINSSVELQGSSVYCNAHRAFPPFFVTALDAGCAAGRVEAAVANLSYLSRRDGPWSPYVSEEAERALLIIAGRMRLSDERRVGYDFKPGGVGRPPGRPGQSDPGALVDALSAGGPVEGAQRSGASGESDTPAGTHASWRRWGIQSGADIRKFDDPDAGFQSADFDAFSLRLDAFEARLMKTNGGGPNLSADFRDLENECIGWFDNNPTRNVEALTLCMRAAALAGAELELESSVSSWGVSSAYFEAVGDQVVGLLPYVGWRRAAEIAFEEGTLLALRLPQQAITLLEFANACYERAGDVPHRLLTAIRLSMAYAQLGRVGKQRRWLEEAVSAYSLLLKLDLTLPQWPELEAVTEGPPGVLLSRMLEGLKRRPTWRPWLVRLLGCIVLSRQAGVRTADLMELRRFVSEEYGAEVQGSREVPPELGPLLRPVKQSFFGMLRTAYGALARVVPALKTAGYLIVGVGVVALLLYLAVRVIQYVFSFFTPVTLWQSLAVLIALFAVGLALPRVLRLYMSAAMSMISRAYRVKSDGKEGDANRSLLTALRLTLIRPRLFGIRDLVIDPAAEVPPNETGAAGRSGSYRELARAVPEKIRKGLDLERRWVGTRYVRCKWVVDDQTAVAPLEAMFQLPSEKIERFEQTRLVCWRDVAVRSPRPASPPAGRLRVVTFASSLAHVDMARAGWGADIITRGCTHTSEPVDALLKTDMPSVSVVHLIGKPLDVNGTLTLDLGGAEAPPTLPQVIDVGLRASGRGVRAATADIVKQFPDLQMCVIQLPPTNDSMRDASSRYEAGLLRRLGADLCRRGVPAVVLLPALREDATKAALQSLGEWVAREATRRPRRWWRAPNPLPTAVRRTQELVAGCYDDKEREASIELALDVCVYDTGEIDLRVRLDAPGGTPA